MYLKYVLKQKPCYSMLFCIHVINKLQAYSVSTKTSLINSICALTVKSCNEDIDLRMVILEIFRIQFNQNH